MLTINKNMNFDGTIQVTSGKDTVTVMTVSAYFNNEGTLNLSKTVQNVTLYEANKDAVDADYVTFETAVYSVVEAAKSVPI